MEDMAENHNELFNDLKLIRAELEVPQLDRKRLNELIDIVLQKQAVLLKARGDQLINANRQINDLILLIKDKVDLVKRLQSQIDYINNHPAYKVYRNTTGHLKSIFKKR